MTNKPPHNEHELELALVRRAGNSNSRAQADRMTMANAIVGQMLGEGVAVKGGSSLRFRYGSEKSRFTMDFERINLSHVGRICKILFRYSDTLTWPPTIVKLTNWDTLYAEQIADLPVCQTVDAAIVWVNDLIHSIVSLSETNH